MDQDTPINTGWNAPGTGTPGTGNTGTATPFGTGNTTPFGTTSATDSVLCPHCGQSLNRGGLEQFLGKLGINEEMINNLKTQFQNVDLDEYLNTARDYLKDGSSKAQTYAKENPGKVAAGVAALALGAGLLYAAVNRDR